MMNFEVEDEIKRLGVQVIFMIVRNIDNNYYDPQLKNLYKDYYQSLLKSDSYEKVTMHQHLVGYRGLHDKINLNSPNLVASPESIFKMLFKKGKLANINFLVDTYNYISVMDRISIGAHDMNKIVGDVTLKLTNGSERFVPLGSELAEPVSVGEYCYFDSSGEVICRLDCKQCDKTKITKKTNSCLIVLQGNNNITLNSLLSSAKQLSSLLFEYNKGDIDYSIYIR